MELAERIKGKNILVTGGAGSLGREIVRRLLTECEPAVVRVFSRDETKQFEMHHEFREYDNVRFLLGDIRDLERIRHAIQDVQFILHAAAYKHVLACEYNPFEAMKTNIMGTANVIQASFQEGVERVVLTSTDKATNPCNTMGVSKLMAERLFTAGNYYKGFSETVFCSVRFGNVAGSRGSVIPLFKEQIAVGGPVTVTDPEMTRFLMSTDDAINLILKAAFLAVGGEIFILKMPVVRLLDLAEVMVREYAPRVGRDPDGIEIKIIGALPGEKMFEDLMTQEECTRVLEIEDMFILIPQMRDLLNREYRYPNAREPGALDYRSELDAAMSQDQIRDYLLENNLLD